MIEKKIINEIKSIHKSIKEYPKKIKVKSKIYNEIEKNLKIPSRSLKKIYGIPLEIDDNIDENYKFVFKAKF